MIHRPSSHSSLAVSRRAAVVGATALVAGALAGGKALAQTPVPGSGMDFTERIAPLLATLPARELDDSMPLAFYYADLAGQLVSVGVERPDPLSQATELPESFFAASVGLPLAARAFQSGLAPDWFATFGFNPFAIGQAFELAIPPQTISIFRDGFDRATVDAALEASGYTMVLQETGGDYWTVGDDIDLESAVGRLGLGTMNSAFVSDDLMVFANRESDVQAVTQAIGGYVPSMLEQELWTGMVGQFSADTVGMIPLAPGVLWPSSSQAAGTPVSAPADAPVDIRYLAFGVRAGSRSAPMALVGEGTPAATPVSHEAAIPARVEARIRYGGEAVASREAQDIAERWATLNSLRTAEPYTKLMTVEDARVSASDPTVAAIDFLTTATAAPQVWIQMIHTRDLAPFGPVVG